MIEILSKFDPGELMGLMAVAGAFLCAIPAVVLGCLLEIRKVGLKQEMLERGMSPEDIRTVLDAGSGRSRKEFRCRQLSKV